ncbi:hypothetical protein Patl1_27471 [Pistacia atlantica]|uniref:Uncharacterized protein n=1 Tax=Pistacia atlantica TaxID=434234 RepID=A0ACC1BBR1_9ROSI|nr:hypothetical protein Patl1_27471 [Pistacia atlantica]
MKQNDIVPNNFIFIFIAKACAQLSNLKYSQMIHTHTREMLLRGMRCLWGLLKKGLTQSVLEAKNLNLLKAVHSIGIQMGMDADIEVATTWISAYAKCSDLNFAELVFYGIDQGLRTVVSWNSMIAGYANNGKVFDAVRFYKWMMLDGFRPDVSTIVSLLSACAQLEALLHGRLWPRRYT